MLEAEIMGRAGRRKVRISDTLVIDPLRSEKDWEIESGGTEESEDLQSAYLPPWQEWSLS